MPSPISETANPKAKILWCVSLKLRPESQTQGPSEVSGLTLERQYWVKEVVFNAVMEGVRADGYVIENANGEIRPYPCYLFQVLKIKEEMPSTTKNVWTADPDAQIVRCISLVVHEMRPHGGWFWAEHLTLGKEYRVVEVNQATDDGVDDLRVVGDHGKEISYPCYLFEVLKRKG